MNPIHDVELNRSVRLKSKITFIFFNRFGRSTFDLIASGNNLEDHLKKTLKKRMSCKSVGLSKFLVRTTPFSNNTKIETGLKKESGGKKGPFRNSNKIN